MITAAQGQKGAALVVAILVMLVLSAMGLVAMKSAADGSWLSATHRVRAQSTSFSDAVVQYGLVRSGIHADNVYGFMQSTVLDDLRESGGGDAGTATLRRGGYRIWVPSDETGDDESSIGELGEKRRLLEDETLFGLESTRNSRVDFRYIVRDPMPGPPAPGFGEEYCFIRVTVASESRVLPTRHVAGEGDADDEDLVLDPTERRQLRSMGRNASEAFIGPIPCGAQ